VTAVNHDDAEAIETSHAAFVESLIGERLRGYLRSSAFSALTGGYSQRRAAEATQKVAE
jgi:hypothetical protein